MLLKGGLVARLDPPRVDAVDLRIEGGCIAARRAGLTPAAGEEVLELSGDLVLPGLVNAHTHLYGALARGMPAPASAPRSFVEILERVWWRLDRALDATDVRLSALVGAIDAARSGTTLLFDHHSSPAFVEGCLAVVRGAIEEVGLRSVVCYETTDRNGSEARDAALLECEGIVEDPGTPLSRGMVGAHASFTLSDATLERLGELVRVGRSALHVHIAEDRVDVDDCRARHGLGLVERLGRYGLLGPHAILAHGVHLSAAELRSAQAAGAWIAHNPRSNRNNGVGQADTRAFRRAALGTDGLDQDVLAEARAAFLGMREAGREDALAAATSLLAGGLELASGFFGVPFGTLDVGAPADLVVLDYRPPTPLTSENLAGHLLFGIDRSHVRSTLVAGRFVLRDRRVARVDEAEVLARARDAASALWARLAG